MSYQSKREQIGEFIDSKLIPIIRKRDLDYKEVIKAIQESTYANESIIEDVIRAKVRTGVLNEVHVLTIPDGEIGGLLKELKDNELEQREEDKKVEEVFEDIDGNTKNDKPK